MSRRFQFGLSELLSASISAALACGLVRLGFGSTGYPDWLHPIFIILAATSCGVAIGTLMHRPDAGAVIGFSLATAYVIAVVAFVLIYGVG